MLIEIYTWALASLCTTVLEMSAESFYQNIFKPMKNRYIQSSVSKYLTGSIR